MNDQPIPCRGRLACRSRAFAEPGSRGGLLLAAPAALPVSRQCRARSAAGRYSFLAADPFDFLESVPADGTDALALLDRTTCPLAITSRCRACRRFKGERPGCGPTIWIGSLERIALPAIDEFHVPALAIGLVRRGRGLRSVDGRAWLVSQGFPELRASGSAAGERASGWPNFSAWLGRAAPGATAADRTAAADRGPRTGAAICHGRAGRADQQLFAPPATCARSAGRSSTSMPATSSR